MPPTSCTRSRSNRCTWPDIDHTVWLGNFDYLATPSKTGTTQQADGKAADWQFFSHPVYRQGVLLFVPPNTKVSYSGPAGAAVSFPLRTRQEITLKFAAPDELPQ